MLAKLVQTLSDAARFRPEAALKEDTIAFIAVACIRACFSNLASLLLAYQLSDRIVFAHLFFTRVEV